MELRALDGRRGTISVAKWLDDSQQVCLRGLCLCSEEGSVTPTAVRLKLEEPPILPLFPSLWGRVGERSETQELR